MQGENTHTQRVRRTLLWCRKEGRQLSNNEQVQTQKQLLQGENAYVAHGLMQAPKPLQNH